MFELLDVIQRIALDSDHVGVFPWLDRSEVIRPAQQVSGIESGGANRFERRHSVARHPLEFNGLGAMRERSRVRAKGNLYARCSRFFETRLMDGQSAGFASRHYQVSLFERAAINLQGRNQVRALGNHLMDGLVIELNAMLDGGDAGIDAVVQPGTVVGVAGNLDSLEAGFIDDGLNLLETEGCDAHDLAVGQEAVAVICIDLDQVRSVIELFTHRLAGLIRAVDELDAARNCNLRSVAFQFISSS